MPVLLTWNVAGRVGDWQRRQAAALAERELDLLCLQEITPGNRDAWEAALAERGLHWVVSEWPDRPAGSRRFAVLIASRGPLHALPPLAIPWPERHLGAVAELPGGRELELHTLHAPLSSKEGLAKVLTLEALFEALAVDSGVPRVVAGDFNTPQYESRDGDIQTFARTRAGNLREELGERHDAAELLLVGELPRRGWRDAFRAVHGYERRDRSWRSRYRNYGYRLDHIVVSPEVRPVACDYVHEWREEWLSDHSAMWAQLELP